MVTAFTVLIGMAQASAVVAASTHERPESRVPSLRAPHAAPPRPNATSAPRPRAADFPKAGAAVVDIEGSQALQAGSLPVRLSAVVGQRGGRVRAEVIDHATASRLGVHGLLLRLDPVRDGQRSGQPAAPTAANVALDYGAFRDAFGANYADRLRLVQYPACVLDHPNEAACDKPTDVPSVNDRNRNLLRARVSLDAAEPSKPAANSARPPTSVAPVSAPASRPVAATQGASPAPQPPSAPPRTPPVSPPSRPANPAAAHGHVFALVAGSSGQAGSFQASPINPAGAWQVGLNSGDFQYSYPVPMPPPIGGKAPTVGLSYSSQSVDGRASVTNNQASWLGIGWNYDPGFIQRDFPACKDTGHPELGGDLCWGGDNAVTLSLGGQSIELVHDASNDTWRARQDNGWRVQRLSGPSKNTCDSTYWTVTTQDGTVYYFGQGKGTGPQDGANTIWAVPVDNVPSTVAHAAGCANYAWRWNLDKVVDTNGNSTIYHWGDETNTFHEAQQNGNATYDRGGWLSRIDYGMRQGAEVFNAPREVLFVTANRCAPAVSSCPAPTPDNGAQFPDVPNDLICDASTPVCPQNGPSFFTTQALTDVITSVHVGSDATKGDHRDLDDVHFAYSFPDPGDGTKPMLWLTSITRTGKARPDSTSGSDVSLPPVVFDGASMANRVDFNPDKGVARLDFWRLTGVTEEMGARIDVAYKQQHPCSAAHLPATAATNTMDCFPSYFAPDAGPPGFGWFHKYLTGSVTVTDRTAGSPPQVTSYAYDGAGAWHHDESLSAPASHQSWSQWRGYQGVRVASGSGASRTVTSHLFFRGMNGDPTDSGSAKDVSVTDSRGASIHDDEPLAGQEREQRNFTADGATELAAEENAYWQQRTLAGPSGHDAYYVKPATRTTRGRTEDGKTRLTETDLAYDPTYATLTSVDDKGDLAHPEQERCVSSKYTSNADAWIIGLRYRQETHEGDCEGRLVALSEALYDGHDDLTAPPTVGNATQSRAYTASGAYVRNTKAYDDYGRVVASTDGNGHTTKTSYNYADQAQPKVTVTDPLGHATTTWLDDRGPVYKVIDPNQHVVDKRYDALGRLALAALPDDDTITPWSYVFDYSVSNTDPSKVTTQQLQRASADGKTGTYVTSYAYLDSLGRARETQGVSPAGGRIVTATRYDDQGRTIATSAPMAMDGDAGSGFANPDSAKIPSETRAEYDSLSRATASALFSLGNERWRTRTAYATGMTRVSPPEGGATTTYTDALGRTTRTVEDSDTGAVTTSFEYDALGDLTSVADAKGNVSRYDYDWLGRRLHAHDPDASDTTTAYDANGNVTASRDAAGVTLINAYDPLGRRIAQYKGTETNPPQATWTYDAAGAIGLLASTARHTPNGDYTEAITYDIDDRPATRTWTLPASEGKLAGTYAEGYAYDLAGHQTSASYPAAGGLTAETVTTAYNDLGLPTTLTGADTYVSQTRFAADGKLAGRTLGAAGAHQVNRNYTYEQDTQRLSTMSATIGVGDKATTAQNDRYTYNSLGDVTRITDQVSGQRHCFNRDALHRLSHAWTTDQDCTDGGSPNSWFGPDPYNLRYRYDDIGNLTDVYDGDVRRSYSYNPSGAGSIRPHAVTDVISVNPNGTPAGHDSYGYDSNGAMSSRQVGGGAASLAWTDSHQLASVTGPNGTTDFRYDADGERLVRHEPGGAATAFVGGTELRVDAQGAVSATRYYTDGVSTVAQRTSAGVNYLFGDAQGSVNLAIDAASGTTWRQRYLPFGASRGGQLPTDRGFLGKVQDASTGLVNLGARYYDAALGRFLSPDPLASLDSQGLNAYSYAENNPTTLSDPTGLYSFGDLWHDVTSAPSKALNAVTQVVKGAADQTKQALSSLGNLLVTLAVHPNDVGRGLVDRGKEGVGKLKNDFLHGKPQEALVDAVDAVVPVKSFARNVVGAASAAAHGNWYQVGRSGAAALGDAAAIGALAIPALGGAELGEVAVLEEGGETALADAGRTLLKGRTADTPNPPGLASRPSALDSWANPTTLTSHFVRHGADFGAASQEEYAALARDFFLLSKSQGFPTKVGPDGAVRIYDPSTNTFGSYTPAGKTRTYFKPTSPTYWSRQPGVTQ